MSERLRVDGKVAMVPGRRPVGVAFATALAEAGADVVVAARRAGRFTERALSSRVRGGERSLHQ